MGYAMRISKAEAERNRARLVDAAAKILREQGIEGVGVDALAKAAGVTHGGVYSHFKSKDDLAAAAVERALQVSAGEWREFVEAEGGAHALARMIRSYVSRTHRDNPGTGCSITSLGAEAGRGGKKLRDVFSTGVTDLIAEMQKANPAPTEAEARERAIVNVATMIGAVVMARAAVADTDLSDDILKLVRRDLLERNNAN
ncbi:MAG: hypothetical protein A4S14_20025 [Proteobacteria bacterium SG_bin9]|nr:MAG: hypothetical protein A4S14_20025 [Proteobacteria bacterium SG_bin9]